MHQQHAADALLAVARRIDDAGTRQQRAGIDAAEGDGADERVVHDLECEQSQRLLVVRQTNEFVAVFIDALDGGHVNRRRQIIHDRVEQGCTPLFLNAEPHSTGKNAPVSTALRIMRFNVASSGSLPSR